MATIKVYHHGSTAGVPPSKNDHEREKRGECEGWTASSTRSNTRFLYSVDKDGLTGQGFALSLTIKDCPETHADWHKIRRAFLMRLDRLGMIRSHWLTEWQRRGCPHLHAAVWFDSPLTQQKLYALIITAWLEVSHKYRSARQSQNVKGILDSIGWFQYLSKHAVRGLGHYQRNRESIPQGWKKTGRMWGYTGNWLTDDAMTFHLNQEAFYQYRRIVRSWRIAKHRFANDIPKLKSARKMLKCNHKTKSPVRGVSEWIDQDTNIKIMFYLASIGHKITN